MKKLLGIVVLGLLFSGCDNLGNKDHIKFDKCWNIEEYKNFKESNIENVRKEWFFEIDLEKETVTRTSIYYDDYFKKNKVKYALKKKVSLDTYSIKSVTKNFIETNYKWGSSYLFNLNNGEMSLNYEISGLSGVNFKCEKY